MDELYERLYEADFEHRRHLDTVDGFLVSILVALIAVGVYYLKTLATLEPSTGKLIFALYGGVYALPLVCALWQLHCSIKPKKKGYISTARVWDNFFHQEKRKRLPTNKSTVAGELAKDEVKQRLRKQHIDAGEVNREILVAKHDYQSAAKKSLAVGVWLMLFGAIPFYLMESTNARRTPTAPVTAPAISGADSSTSGDSDRDGIRQQAKGDPISE